MDLDQVKREIEALAEELKKAKPAPVASHNSSPLPPLLPIKLPQTTSHQVTSKNINDLSFYQLLHLSDRRFIHSAYQRLLKHPPDPQGEHMYLERLRKGMSQAEILTRLRFSSEGRRQAGKCRGLVWVILLTAIYKTPLLGSMFRWLVTFISLPQSQLQQQNRIAQLEDQFTTSQVLIERRLNDALLHINRLKNKQTS